MVGKPYAAQTLGVSERTVRRLIDSGDLPAFKVGAQWRLLESDLAAYVAAQRSA
ncbi:helix-turn-helix domain-containing protein [Streptomyces sp. NP160]|nr:helix-turn-helix domain-containing protein [Streptomyces sp. NP160]